MIAAMYGSPPRPGSGRDYVPPMWPTPPISPIEAPGPNPVGALDIKNRTHGPQYEMAWNGVAFRWVAGVKFEGAALGGSWDAQVFPDGLHWRAIINLCGGKREGSGESPTAALDNARNEWARAVERLGAPTAEVKP